MKFFDDPLTLLNDTRLVERFVEYTKIDTTSDANNEQCPSTQIQFDLAYLLVRQLKELGLNDAAVDDNCYVTATLNGTGSATVGLIAHLDTSSAAPGNDVNPVFHENYDGSVIKLKDNTVIDPATDDYLSKCIGDTIITADGTTLLGADDKAGIAIIMAALEYYNTHPEHPHPTIKVGFTPAELSPECTEGREGFIHPFELHGDATSCKCHLILRDFEEDKVLDWIKKVKAIAESVQAEDDRLKIDMDTQFSYPNMHKFLREKPEIARHLTEAVTKAGIEPRIVPIRGGTDGSNLTRKGLPTPNIFMGGVNFHGPTEWISTKAMGYSLCTVLNLMNRYADPVC